jgi:cobalt/nickel transport system permease protein
MMQGSAGLLLWAVHISDGVLTGPWLVGGFALAAALALVGAWRIRDEEIPKVALLTAAFFVASLIHVRVPPTSVHLVLNGLVGVILGRRSCLAIPVGLFLQASLIGHGGFSTLGVNSCVMVLPALLAGLLFAGLRRLPWVQHPWSRAVLVAGSTAGWLLSLVYSGALLTSGPDTRVATAVTFHPLTQAAVLVLVSLAAAAERRLEAGPEFALGLLVGELAVLATTFLNAAVLLWGGQGDWHALVLLVVIMHLPIAVIEGIVLGFTVSFLARVKPELLGWLGPEEAAPLPPNSVAADA